MSSGRALGDQKTDLRMLKGLYSTWPYRHKSRLHEMQVVVARRLEHDLDQIK